MKKRIISLLMTFCLVFSFMPTSSAMAESEEADITGGTRQSGGVPVYVCAETMYNGGIYKGAVEGLTRNGSGWVTLGKLISQQALSLAVGSNNQGESYGADSDQLKAVAAELATSQFTYHDDGVKGYLNLVDQWTKLVCQTGSHDGYKGEEPGGPNNGSVRAYHLDGAIDVCKVTFQYGSGTEDLVRYYPESNDKKTIRVVRPAAPSIDGKWFLGWYTADGKLYDFGSSVTTDLVLTAKWRDMVPGEGPDVSTVMLRVRDVNEKHAAVHGTADYYLQPTDGTGSGIQDVNGVYTYTFTVTDPADFLTRYNTGEGNGALRGTPPEAVTALTAGISAPRPTILVRLSRTI